MNKMQMLLMQYRRISESKLIIQIDGMSGYLHMDGMSGCLHIDGMSGCLHIESTRLKSTGKVRKTGFHFDPVRVEFNFLRYCAPGTIRIFSLT